MSVLSSLERAPSVGGFVEYEAHSDCDSEGNAPPKDVGEFVDPLTIDESNIPPPRSNVDLRLPFFQAGERRRLREHFESRVTYEEWVEGTVPGRAAVGVAAVQPVSGKRDVKKLEEDSDYPLGKPHFWHAFCTKCSINYHPHVPGMWACGYCKGKVWQPADDPESKHCAVCRRGVAAIRLMGTRKLRNPLALNAHMCKRCGRVVCDQCYTLNPVPVEEYGFSDLVRICARCHKDRVQLPPEEEDLGAIYDDQIDIVDDAAQLQPFWPPRCRSCNIGFPRPPPRWECMTCHSVVWQPTEAADSASCWLCAGPFPKVACHKCGRLVCESCGAYGQPLPDVGWIDGLMRPVCKACYQGLDNRPPKLPEDNSQALLAERTARVWRGSCPICRASGGGQGDQWLSKCHRRKTWQPDGDAASKHCACCDAPLAEGSREHCHRCGRVVCFACCQYKQPLPEQGFVAGVPICRVCFHPETVLAHDPRDGDIWMAKCNWCGFSSDVPPARWRCPQQCGLVWQPQDHAISYSCFVCGRRNGGASVNCRRCGRLVCGQCSQGRAEVPERGFTKGIAYPVCPPCLAEAQMGLTTVGGGVVPSAMGSFATAPSVSFALPPALAGGRA